MHRRMTTDLNSFSVAEQGGKLRIGEAGVSKVVEDWSKARLIIHRAGLHKASELALALRSVSTAQDTHVFGRR